MTSSVVTFSKYNGCGNDFLFFDNRANSIPKKPSFIQNICDRKRGIGADGVILLEKSNTADVRMVIFNADGSEAEMCGNGLRCFIQYLSEKGIHDQTVKVETKEKIVQGSKRGDDLIEIQMGRPFIHGWNLPIDCYTVHFLDTGVPHAVLFINNWDKIDVFAIGSMIRNHHFFSPKGTNVTFVRPLSDNTIEYRTFERGVENETEACGTGAAAAAIASHQLHNHTPPIKVYNRNRDKVEILFSKNKDDWGEITQIGPVQFVFQGEVALEDK